MTIERFQPRMPFMPSTEWLGVFLGILASLVPAAVRGYVAEFDGSLFFPVFWIGGAVIVLPLLYLIAIINKIALRIVQSLALTFLVTTPLVIYLGFDWTGDWIRFTAFEAGFGQLQVVEPKVAMNDVFYHWRGWGIAGLENDAYLLTDRSGEIARLPLGATIEGSACALVGNRPMIPPWRLVTTFECNLFGP